jgi:large subunit ribosomal protein L4
MQLDVVNHNNEKIGAVDVRDDVFGGRVNTGLIWESVVRANAAARQGTHATKNRALVSGSGKKPWRQKGTGRARVGEIRNPLWRKGGTVFGPQPRSYEFKVPKKVELGALRAALAQKLQDGELIIVEALTATEFKTKSAVEMLKRLGVSGKAVLVDVTLDDKLVRSVRNLPGVIVRQGHRLTPREVMNAGRVVTTQSAFERLQEALAS